MIGKTWVMYENIDEGNKLVETSSQVYQTYTPAAN